MNILEVIGTLAAFTLIFAAVFFVPGYLLVRGRFAADEDAEITASLLLSFFAVYIFSFFVYTARLSPIFLQGYSLLCLAAALFFRKSLIALFRRRAFRQRLAAAAVLFIWSLFWLASMRMIAAGGWSGDWYEHYERSLFFLEQKPIDTRFLGMYALTARPPFFNLLCAFGMAHIGHGFWHYQLIQLFLNMTVVFGCFALVSAFGASERRWPWLVVLFLGLNPAFLQNMTYGWPRALAGFFALSSIAFYLRYVSSRSIRDGLCAFAAMGVGVLTHYSIMPYLVALFALQLFWLRPFSGWRAGLAFCGVVFLVLGTWIFWGLAVFGARGTFLQNTTAMGMAGHDLFENLRQGFFNLKISLLPPYGPENPAWPAIRQSDKWGLFKDVVFSLYQSNLIFMFGSLLPCVLVVQHFKTPGMVWRQKKAQAFIIFCVLAGSLALFVIHDRFTFGVGHSCHQPIVFALLSLSAAGFPAWPRPVRWIAGAGWCLDFLLGILLLFAFQHRSYTDGLSLAAKRNAAAKAQYELIFLADQLQFREAK